MFEYCELENPTFFEKYICIFLNKNIWNKVEPELWFEDKNKKKYYKVKDLSVLKKIDYFHRSMTLSIIKNTIKSCTTHLTDRLNLYILCKKIMPKTYLIYGKLPDNFKIQENKIYFLKENNKNYNTGITIINNTNSKNIEAFIDISKNYVLQHNVENLLLYNNYKFHVRIYLLVNYENKYKYYIYNEGLLALSKDKYDINNKQSLLSRDRKQNKLNYENYFSNYKYYNILFKNIKKYVTYLVKQFSKICKNPENKSYMIMGLDFIFNKKGIPFLLEINEGPVMGELNIIMIKELVDIVFNNKKNINFIKICVKDKKYTLKNKKYKNKTKKYKNAKK